MSEFFTEQERADMTKAKELDAQVQILGDQADALMEPIVKRILDNRPPEELKILLPEIIEELPPGFYRSELRQLMFQIGAK